MAVANSEIPVEVELPAEFEVDFDKASSVEDFVELADKYFEPADEETLAFRKKCKENNVGSIFCSGLSRDQVLEMIISSKKASGAH